MKVFIDENNICLILGFIKFFEKLNLGIFSSRKGCFFIFIDILNCFERYTVIVYLLIVCFCDVVMLRYRCILFWE